MTYQGGAYRTDKLTGTTCALFVIVVITNRPAHPTGGTWWPHMGGTLSLHMGGTLWPHIDGTFTGAT